MYFLKRYIIRKLKFDSKMCALFFVFNIINKWTDFNKFDTVEKVLQSTIISYRFLFRFLRNTSRKIKVKKTTFYWKLP